MLSPEQITHYHEHGYVIPGYRLPEKTLAAIRADHDRLLAEHPDHPEFRDNCSALLNFDMRFLNYARNPEILDMVEQLIGPDITLWNMSFFAKPARNGKRTPWHQDGQYWPIRPLATCTVWIAVDAATTENGCMRFIPGSHRDQRLRAHDQRNDPALTLQQELQRQEYDESEAVDVVLEAGQISLHDVYLVHGSEVNTSPHPRRGMTMRLMPTSSLYDRELAARMHRERGGATMSEHSIFLMRGADQAGNDYRLRA
ncbi:MAG: phytanoyl-CoA dioxygenase family protein [Ectothiorhodospiraceae bacterium]|nr:phytanoyl-CoA dioxygenase family protein [Chromatiales bacterium]MCP5154916.1 phytanoyl-CoA dioxygenase family protein [Ectothiorhodospiraceae bacterium]